MTIFRHEDTVTSSIMVVSIVVRIIVDCTPKCTLSCASYTVVYLVFDAAIFLRARAEIKPPRVSFGVASAAESAPSGHKHTRVCSMNRSNAHSFGVCGVMTFNSTE